MNNKPYFISSMRYWGTLFMVVFAFSLSSATNPPVPTTDPDPCRHDYESPRVKAPDDIVAYIDCDEDCTKVKCGEAEAWDDCDPHPKIYYDVDEHYCFREGTTEVWVWAVDRAGNKSKKHSFLVTVKQRHDKKAPKIKCPDDVVAFLDCDEDCTKIKHGKAEAWDDCDHYPDIEYDVTSDYCFREGTTAVWAWATDRSGNESRKCSFDVIIKKRPDTKPPVIVCPANIAASIDCNETCARVSFATPKATDDCDKNPTVTCNFVSGACFPIGTTTVVCTTKDKSGNSAICSFNVVVTQRPDVTPPVIVCPANITASFDCNETCARVTFTTPRATDVCDPNPTVTCNFVSGACFPLGTTAVVCTARDRSGNTATCTFNVIVTQRPDVTPPVITCPANIVVDIDCRSTATCAVATYVMPRATDNCDPNPTVTCSIASGTCFAVGTTTVTCTARDRSGNTSSCSFTVTVRRVDRTPPVITCRRDIVLHVDCKITCSRFMSFTDPVVTDDCDPNPMQWCEVNGQRIDLYYCFPLGTTRVVCNAQDLAGNRSSCSFNVIVREKEDTQPPTIICPADIMATAARGTFGAVVNFATPVVRDNCDPRPTVTCNFPSNFCFPLGKTIVTCTARDASGNTSTCTFTVMVMDMFDLVRVNNMSNEATSNKDGKAGKSSNFGTDNNAMALNLPASQNLIRNDFSIYPNPTSGFVSLELAQYEGKNVAVQILNSVGQQMYNIKLKEVANQPYRIDMQEYPTGIYLIKVMAEGVEPVAKKVMRR